MSIGKLETKGRFLCYNFSMEDEVRLHGVYRHFKGDYYLVEDIVFHSETKEKMVLYRALYGDGRLWARPYSMWLEEVDRAKYPGIKQKYRFELQSSFKASKPRQRVMAIAGSSKFYRESLDYKMLLENAGYKVFAYITADGDNNWRKTYEDYYARLMRADDIFVLNLNKKGIKGYIGYETFAELSHMVVRKINGEDVNIYLHQLPSRKCGCYDEISEMYKHGWLKIWGE